MPRFLPRPAAAVAGCAVALLLTAAVPASSAKSGATLKKYQIVTLHSSLGAHAVGEVGVSCPTGLHVVGGGVSGESTNETITSSYPDEDDWSVSYQNPDDTASGLTTYAVCVKGVQSYSDLPGFAREDSPGTQSTTSVVCPSSSVVFGGGGYNSSYASTVNLNSIVLNAPTGFVLTTSNNAGTAGDATQTVVVCGTSPAGYRVVTGSQVSVPPNTQSTATASCPAGTHVLSGGARSASGSTRANLNASYPDGTTGWRAYENNFSTSSDTLTVTAICATTAS